MCFTTSADRHDWLVDVGSVAAHALTMTVPGVDDCDWLADDGGESTRPANTDNAEFKYNSLYSKGRVAPQASVAHERMMTSLVDIDKTRSLNGVADVTANDAHWVCIMLGSRPLAPTHSPTPSTEAPTSAPTHSPTPPTEAPTDSPTPPTEAPTLPPCCIESSTKRTAVCGMTWPTRAFGRGTPTVRLPVQQGPPAQSKVHTTSS